MAEEKKQSVTVYSYRKVWFVEKKIYAFQNIVLPFPIAPYEVLEFLAVVGAMLVMGRIFPILSCGSKSTNKTRLFSTPSEAAKFILDVVFPTPPF